MAIYKGHQVAFTKPFSISGANWEDTITDSWDQIIANANAGTVSGYSVGDTKTLEFVYDGISLAIQCELIGKSHDTISGTQNKAALTFQFNQYCLTYRANATASNAGGWMGEDGDVYSSSLDETDGQLTHGCELRKDLWQLYKAFPSNVKNAIKTVDKKYDDTNGLQTAKDKLFCLCPEELNASYTNSVTGQGTAYSDKYTGTSASIKKNGIGQPFYWLRSRRTNNQHFLMAYMLQGTIQSAAANTYYSVCPAFCL